MLANKTPTGARQLSVCSNEHRSSGVF